MAIYKYFTQILHAKDFIGHGVMLFRPLSYFRATEDSRIRGDEAEGILTFDPPGGLEVTKANGEMLNLTGCRFTSSVNANNIFVFCASNTLSKRLAEDFSSAYVVEVPTSQEISSRLGRRAHRSSKLDYSNVLSGNVEYVEPDAIPGADWALPHKISFRKPSHYSWQNEFRFAIGRAGALDVENVSLRIENANQTISGPLSKTNGFKISIGSLRGIARMHKI